MATCTVVPITEYLRTGYDPDCDWIDGELRERNLGEGPHSFLQKFFILYFGLREDSLQVVVWPEQRVQVAPTRFRIPDVCLTRKTDSFERIIRNPPILCIEIPSSEDRMSDMQEKVEDYLAMRVRTVWLLDPHRRKAFQTDGQSVHPVMELTVPQTEIHITVADVFAGLEMFDEES